MASVIWIPVIFFMATFGLYTLSQNMPEATHNNGTVSIKFPTNFEDLTKLASTLGQYKTEHLFFVYCIFSCAYIYKQTFAIPGSVFMNVLAGAIFGTMTGFPLVCLLSAIGASCCYTLSKYFGKSTIKKYFPDKLQYFQKLISDNMDSLFFFLLFLRFFPMSPNWAMNMTCPLLNVPLHMFFITAFIGLMPYNFIGIQTGSMLSEIQSLDEMFTSTTAFKLLFLASVALVPGLLIKKYQKHKLKLS